MQAFFTDADLKSWWGVTRAFTVARPLGMYAIEWESTDFKDEVLGRLGGAFHGTIIDYRPNARVLPRRSLLAAARRRSDRPDGARGALPPARQRPPDDADGQAERRRRRPALGALLQIMGRGWEGALGEMKDFIDREIARTRIAGESRVVTHDS